MKKVMICGGPNCRNNYLFDVLKPKEFWAYMATNRKKYFREDGLQMMLSDCETKGMLKMSRKSVTVLHANDIVKFQ